MGLWYTAKDQVAGSALGPSRWQQELLRGLGAPLRLGVVCMRVYFNTSDQVRMIWAHSCDTQMLSSSSILGPLDTGNVKGHIGKQPTT